MPTAQRTKASDKQAVCKKLTTILKKRYKRPAADEDRPILETIIFAVCLENASPEDAGAAYKRLHTSFHDLNEMRVSSISELAQSFQNLDEADWRALRVRSTLQYVFEKYFAFDFESIRRKTFEQAQRQLLRIHDLSPFVRAYTLQVGLGVHVVPLDERMFRALVWLGLADPGSNPEEAAEALKSALRKSDAPLFCHLLHCLATDPDLMKTFQRSRPKEGEQPSDLDSAPSRLTELFKQADSRKRRAAAKRRSAGSKSAARRKAASKPKSAAKTNRSKTTTARTTIRKKK